MSNTRIHRRACNLCEAICGLVIEVKDEAVVSIRGDENDPLSRGHICPKAVALKDIYHDPDRLRQPVKRTADGWVTIGWEEAYAEVAERLLATREQHGRAATGVYLGNPNVHNYGSSLYLPDLLRSLRTPNTFSATSADQLPHHLVAKWMFGHYFYLPVSDIDRTDFMLIIGANPLVSNGSLMTAPGFGKRMRAVQIRGRVVVIDPRRTETAAKADEHHFIRPGTDAYLLLAMLQTLFFEQWIDLGHLQDHVHGLEEVKRAVQDYDPESVAGITEIEAATIRDLTAAFVQAKSAVCYGRMGISTQAFGSLCIWAVNLLNLLTGNFDRAGGAMFTSPALGKPLPGRSGKLDRWRSRVSGYPERFGELPVAAITEEMTTPGDGQIRAFISVAGNPVLSTADGQALDEALAKLDFMVAIDIYINETTRHADIILPPATGLETSHYDVAFHTLAVRNTAKFSDPCFGKTEAQRYDYEILQELSRRLRGGDYQPLAPQPEHIVDALLQRNGLSLAELRENPSGIDLGPLRPQLPEGLYTEDHKIALAPPALLEDLDRLRKQWTSQPEVDPTYPLLLIGRRQLRSNNSWMHNSERLVKGGERCTLLLHPKDAARYGITNDQPARVHSAVGSVTIKVEISDEVMAGVVSIPHGWGHARAGIRMRIAEEHPGVSVNDLTRTDLVDELSGNAVFNGVPVRVESV